MSVVVFDLECTAWPGSLEHGWSREGEAREVIEIGAVRAEETTLKEEDVFTQLVRPLLNPLLSDYITGLTGITQGMIDAEEAAFPDALSRFLHWSGDATFLSWGRDIDILNENCELHGLPPLPEERFLDARTFFYRAGIDADRYHSSSILSAFGIELPSSAHRAGSDATCVLRALQKLREEEQYK